MATRGDWLNAFLFRLGYPVNFNTEIAVLTWIRSEWGSASPIPATFNPLNCVTPRGASTIYNSIGVQNYVTWDDGVEASALTLLENGHNYDPVRNSLAAGAPDLVAFIAAVSASDWGSKPTLNFLTYVEEHLDFELAYEVGFGPTPLDDEDNMLLSPLHPDVAGRQPYAWLNRQSKQVILYNGASVVGDVATGSTRVWTVPSTFAVSGMCRTRDPNSKLPDNRGIVVGAFDGGTFQALWR